MTVLLRLAVFVLLVYVVLCTVTKTRRNLGQPEAIPGQAPKDQRQKVTSTTNKNNYEKMKQKDITQETSKEKHNRPARKGNKIMDKLENRKNKQLIKSVDLKNVEPANSERKTTFVKNKHQSNTNNFHSATKVSGAKKETKKSAKIPAKTKSVPKKTVPRPIKEFPLSELIFRGRASNEANAFIRTNNKVGKPLELAYEYVREQDLNEIENRLRRRYLQYSR